MQRSFLRYVLATAALLVTMVPAQADKIDGSWCSPEGKSMTIMGRRITTPGGTSMQGDYTRHTFRYDVPENESGAGDRVWAEQLNEEAIAVTVYKGADREAGPREIWTRCQVIS